MKNLLIFLGISCAVLYCKAQQLPLNTFLDDIPTNAYIKDFNNELGPYVGTYKTNYQGDEIKLFITKVEDKLEESSSKNYYTDALIVKYTIKNSSGIILQDTQNGIISTNKITSIGTKPHLGIIILYYEGTNCGIGWGNIYLKKINNTQISWEYRPNSLVIDSATCPPSTDKKVYLPVTKDLIFTKQ